MTDVLIIGGGICGSAIARELSRYKINITVLEKGIDVSSGTSKANSGIVHAGFDAEPGTLKGKLNAKSNAMFDTLAKELDFSFRRSGALVLCFDDKDIPKLEDLKARGEKNGVKGLTIISRDELLNLEPNISDDAVAALYAPSSGIVCPYEMTIAFAENAVQNGAKFIFNEKVISVSKSGEIFTVKTQSGKEYTSKILINAAGLYADEINNMLSGHKLKIQPRKGEYSLFDKAVFGFVNHTIFQLPTKLGKGVLVTPTVEGNMLIGPNAEDVDYKTYVSTTEEGNKEIFEKAELSVKNIPYKQVIKSFSGLRAHESSNDFIIGEADDCENFINVAGIESPGLSSAPAIALMVVDIIKQKHCLAQKDDFNPCRRPVIRFRDLDNESRDRVIKENPAYGRIVCRCETVTEGEILDAIHRPLGATTVDGIKRRTRAGLGRCQSGFCSPRIVEILARELGVDITEVTSSVKGSNILIGKDKLIGDIKDEKR